jgi:hypothetical protein
VVFYGQMPWRQFFIGAVAAVIILFLGGFFLIWRPAIAPIDAREKPSVDEKVFRQGAELASIGNCNDSTDRNRERHLLAGGRYRRLSELSFQATSRPTGNFGKTSRSRRILLTPNLTMAAADRPVCTDCSLSSRRTGSGKRNSDRVSLLLMWAMHGPAAERQRTQKHPRPLPKFNTCLTLAGRP